ncbi:MAG: sulfotransferase [Sterolibacterium sp.]|nr:sulfotransferase [Sterolibacterium sp.]
MKTAVGDASRLDLPSIVEASRAETGLSDMGEPDILPGLRVLIDALVNEANLHPSGVDAQRHSLIGHLSNRLRINDIFKRHPEIFKGEIRGPIVIIGLPRSGTTKLQCMMAANSALQSLPLWKVLNPAPMGATPPGGEDPRIALAEKASAAMREHHPDFYAGHPMNAREPEEEVWMEDLVMRGWNPCYLARVPTFEAWTGKQDYSTWYVYLRKLLQMFQWQDGSPQKTWLLKTPEHMPHMDLLFKTFPRATIVHCHRDPVTTIASLAALIVASRRMFSDDETSADAGRFALEHWSKNTQAYMQQRQLLEKQHRFVDIGYKEITGDVTAAIERIHAAAGLELTAEARTAMRAWEANNPPGKHGRHKYTLESVGLRESDIRAAFADYLERFGKLI